MRWDDDLDIIRGPVCTRSLLNGVEGREQAPVTRIGAPKSVPRISLHDLHAIDLKHQTSDGVKLAKRYTDATVQPNPFIIGRSSVKSDIYYAPRACVVALVGRFWTFHSHRL